MSQVIIVSNRLPINVKKVDGKLEFSPSVGGLATGLSSYANSKSNVWIGWPGIASDDLTKSDRDEIITELAKHHCAPVFLTQKQIDSFYNGYSNTVLWPLFHELKTNEWKDERREHWYRVYREVNKLFAETIDVTMQRGAYVWVHDYQLLLVPSMLRRLNSDVTIGFFLHIPFPSVKVFDELPEGRKLLKGITGADLIGFHTTGYVENFIESCSKNSYVVKAGDHVSIDGRDVRVSHFPMGIDYDKYASSGRSTVVRQAAKLYKNRYQGRKIIVAVDRMDPSKGLLERLQAYGEFLESYPEQWERVVLAMVASPSRTDVPAYRRLAKRMDALVEEINDTYGTDTWQPIDYINETLPFEHVTALFQIADVAFIAPLRDGMNLAAKEFVASTHKNSVLILSETAGASQELHDALIVDPGRRETVVRALHDALTMRRPELDGRLRRMKKYLKDHTVYTWARDFVGALNSPLIMPQSPVGVQRLDNNRAEADFKNSKKRLLLLDYDGTLVGFQNDPEKVKPSRELINILERLAGQPSTDVIIISGRSMQYLNKHFGKLPIHLVAEHGVSHRRAGKTAWETRSGLDIRWQKVVLPVLERYAALTPGAHVEVKAHSLVWHYRASPSYYAHKHIVIIRRMLNKYLKENGLEIQKGNKVLEFKNPAVTKGTAANEWLARGYDFVLAAGDDTTDEDMFKVMPEGVYSIKVGSGLTAARYRVADNTAMIRLLKNLSKAERP